MDRAAVPPLLFDLERVEVWHDKRLVKLARRADRVLNSELGGHDNYDY